MIYPPQSPSPLVSNWVDRHRDPRSFVLHLFGIPCTILGVLLLPIYLVLVSMPIFGLSLMLFFGGFGLQFLGHALEGSEPGEVKALRLWLSRRRESRSKLSRIRMALPDGKRA